MYYLPHGMEYFANSKGKLINPTTPSPHSSRLEKQPLQNMQSHDLAIDSEMWQCSAKDHICIIYSNGSHTDINSRIPTNHDSGKA